jgi:2-hydroxychromene-2-carboxylate isomerase
MNMGHDADRLLGDAGSKAIQEKLQDNTIWAQERNIFGSPTYIVDGDPFYGQDHLLLVERVLSRPFAAPTWSNPAVGRASRPRRRR